MNLKLVHKIEEVIDFIETIGFTFDSKMDVSDTQAYYFLYKEYKVCITIYWSEDNFIKTYNFYKISIRYIGSSDSSVSFYTDIESETTPIDNFINYTKSVFPKEARRWKIKKLLK